MISTHILDTTKGLAAAGVKITLEKKEDSDKNGAWKKIGEGATNSDGRLAFDIPKDKGTYKLEFHIEDYFKGSEHFFLNTPVIFQITNTERKYHVPLLLNPYGYSTYRGT
jgi:5-hydroxyisourate hydrolase